MTTIAISKELRDEIKEFGNKGETYEDILQRVLKNVRENQLQNILMDTSSAIPVKEALERAKEKWQ